MFMCFMNLQKKIIVFSATIIQGETNQALPISSNAKGASSKLNNLFSAIPNSLFPKPGRVEHMQFCMSSLFL